MNGIDSLMHWECVYILDKREREREMEKERKGERKRRKISLEFLKNDPEEIRMKVV